MTRNADQPCPHEVTHPMCIVAAPQRLASAAVLFLRSPRRHLPTGSTSSRLAAVPLPRSPPCCDLDGQPPPARAGTPATAGRRLANPGHRLQAQRPRPHRYRRSRPSSPAPLRPKAPVCRSPPSAASFSGQRTPSVAALGRLTQQAGQRAGLLLEVLDQQARPHVRQGRRGRNLLWLQAGAHGRRTPEPLLAQRSPVHQPSTSAPGPANSGNYGNWSM